MKKYFSLFFPVLNLLGIILVLFVLFHFNKGAKRSSNKTDLVERINKRDFPRQTEYSVKETNYRFASKKEDNFLNF